MEANTWFSISIVGYSLAGVLLVVAIILFFKMNIRAIIGDLTGKTAARQIQEIREQNTKSGNKRYKPNAFNIDRGSLTEPVATFPTRSSRLPNSYKSGDTGKTIAPVSKPLFESGQTVETPWSEVIDSKPTEVLGQQENHLNSSDQTVVLFSQDTDVLGESQKYTAEVSAATEVLIQKTEVLDVGTEILGTDDGIGGLFQENWTEVLGQERVTENGTEVLSEDKGTTVLYPTTELVQHDETKILTVEFKIVKDIKITHTSERI